MEKETCIRQGPSRVWRFVHHSDFSYRSTFLIGRSFTSDWLEIKPDGEIKVLGSFDRGYAWDGCTPKWNFLHITWGIFDGNTYRFGPGDYKPRTYYASMVHDVLYQYKRCAPVTRKEADLIFLEMLLKADFLWAQVYYIGVRMFGWIFRGWKYASSNGIKSDYSGIEEDNPGIPKVSNG